MFRKSISLKCGHVVSFSHRAARGTVKVVYAGAEVNFMALKILHWHPGTVLTALTASLVFVLCPNCSP